MLYIHTILKLMGLPGENDAEVSLHTSCIESAQWRVDMLNAKDVLQARFSRNLKKVVRKAFVVKVRLVLILEERKNSGEYGQGVFQV